MSILRPDERASQAEIERSQRLQRGAQGVAATAITLGGASRILPFLSENIPVDLAVKGISKLSPKVGDFLKRGAAHGLNIKDGLDFIKDNFSKEEPKQPQDKRNIIEQYSPELYQFINEHVQKGGSPLQAGAIAEMGGKFKAAIKKMVKDHKTPWSSIIETVFGKGENIKNPIQTSPSKPEQQNLPPNQPGQGQQALMNILQKIQQSRGA